MSAEGEFTSTNDVFMSTNDDDLSFHKELNPGNGELSLAGDEFTLYGKCLRQTRCSFVISYISINSCPYRLSLCCAR